MGKAKFGLISRTLKYGIILHSHVLRTVIERNTDTRCIAIYIAIWVFHNCNISQYTFWHIVAPLTIVITIVMAVDYANIPEGTQCQNDFILTLMQPDNVASTSVMTSFQRHLPAGIMLYTVSFNSHFCMCSY